MDVSAAADELYGLMPDQFVHRRAELAAQAGDDGQARKQILALRKPTVAAWTVNLVVREHAEDVQELLQIAAQLRAAQRALAPDRMRELGEQRRQAVTTLTRAAGSLARQAGRPVGETVLRDVQASFEAAVADENAERALRTGRLTTAMSYSGFGEVDISDAVAALDARPRLAVIPGAKDPSHKSTTREAPPQPAERPAVAERAAQRRQAALETAQHRLDEAKRHRDELVAEAEQLRRRLADLDRELQPAQAAVRAAQRKVDAVQKR